jgi:hypothetical protein
MKMSEKILKSALVLADRCGTPDCKSHDAEAFAKASSILVSTAGYMVKENIDCDLQAEEADKQEAK